MSTMAQYRQQQLANLNTQLDNAVMNGDQAEGRKIAEQIAAVAGDQSKFTAADVRAAVLKLAPEAGTSLKLIAKINGVTGAINPEVVARHDTPESLAREILEAAGHELPDADDDDAGGAVDDDNEPAARNRKPARMSREEPQLGAGRPSGARGLDKATKVSDLPQASRAAWDRMTRGPMQQVAKEAAHGDERAKAYMTKAEADFVKTEKTRLQQAKRR